MAASTLAISPAPTDFRWTREGYEELVEKGVFGPDDKIELLDGRLISMAPQHSAHSTAHSTAYYLCLRYLERVFPDGFMVRPQLPFTLDEDSVPEPDLAVVRGTPRDFSKQHPSEATLIVEVSDSSLRYDRGEKLAAYARAGIPEYWIVNLIERRIEIYRRPEGEGYAVSETYSEDQNIAPDGREATAATVAELLP